MGLDLEASSEIQRINDKHKLMSVIREISEQHPWHFKVSPMSEEERVWFDLDSPLRKKK